MAVADRSADDATFKTVQARVRDGNVAPLSAIQQAATGKAGALDVRSDNADVAAATVRGAGDLLDLKDSSGVSQFTVTQAGAVTVTGDQTVTGDYTITGDLTVNGGAVFNEASADEDFRVESNGNANMLFVDGGTDKVGIGNAAPEATLDVTGTFHASSFANGEPSPASQSLVSWTYDPIGAVNTQLLTNGTVYLAKLLITQTVNVTKFYWWMPVAGVTPTAGQNFGGLYDSSGTRLVTADADATVDATAGLQTLTIASTALTAGTFVWGAVVFNAGTAPTLAYSSGATGATTALNVGLTAATFRFATNGTSQTSLPASITPGSNSASLIGGPWMAVGE